MPGFDRTGPWGEGPRTGGGFGDCGTGARAARKEAFGQGRGFGPRLGGRGLQRGFRRGFCRFGRGRGAGFGGWPAPGPSAVENAGVQMEAEDLRRRLDLLEQRIAGLAPAADEAPEA